MIATQFLFAALLIACARRLDVDAEIISAPSSNETVPLNRATAVNFTCRGRGTFVYWNVNGEEVTTPREYENPNVEIHQVTLNGISTITIAITVNYATNNTRLRCETRQLPPNPDIPDEESDFVTLTIAGPPLPPHPIFHVVNATHIKVQWDKPYSLPGFDVKNFTLTTRSEDSQLSNKFEVTPESVYPIVHYISNGGNIPQECFHMNFTLTATNEAGTSDEGFATGGFPIAPRPIDNDMVYIRVTHSSSDFNPILQINFTFPTVCDYHDAFYSVLVYDVTEAMIVARTRVMTYDRDGPDSLEVVVDHGMQKDRNYVARINVTTAVNSTIHSVPFITNVTLSTGGITVRSAEDNSKTYIASGAAVGLFIILLVVAIILLVVFIMRRRKLKLLMRAQQHDIVTDEAVQRAAQSMVPNPIYSGNPIYEEIVDSTKLKSLTRTGYNESHPRDDGYVGIVEESVKMVNGFAIPEESKCVGDKYATFPEDTYTVMNPAGTLTNQTSRRPTDELPPTDIVHNGAGMLSEQQSAQTPTTTTTQATTAAGLCTGSLPNPMFLYTDDERYVVGNF